MTKKTLNQVWQQVPPDYYDRGMANNMLQRIWHTRKFQVFRQLTGKRDYKKILDVGCAGGTMTAKIANFFPQSLVYGVDVYDQAIAYAKRKYPQMSFTVCDAHRLPFAANSFDLIVCYETIEHVVDPLVVLREILRVLKKDGICVVAMDSGNWLFRLVWWFWEKTTGRVWQGAHLHPFHYNELEERIRQAGFHITERRFSHVGMEVSFLLSKEVRRE